MSLLESYMKQEEANPGTPELTFVSCTGEAPGFAVLTPEHTLLGLLWPQDFGLVGTGPSFSKSLRFPDFW